MISQSRTLFPNVFIAMRLSPFAISSVLILSACAAPSIQPDEDANGTATHSGSYVNAEYGFSLEYPTHFQAIREIEPALKNQGAYVEESVLKFKELNPALRSFGSRDMDINAAFSLEVSAYPLQGYSQDQIYDPEYEYVYDAATDSWKGVVTGSPFQPETQMIGGKKAYVFGFGDSGLMSQTYAVPLPEKNVVLEFVISSCVACTDESEDSLSDNYVLIDANTAHVEKEREEILNGIRFVD